MNYVFGLYDPSKDSSREMQWRLGEGGGGRGGDWKPIRKLIRIGALARARAARATAFERVAFCRLFCPSSRLARRLRSLARS